MKNLHGSRQAFVDIKDLLTLRGASKKRGRQIERDDLSIIQNAAMVCENGKVKWVGAQVDLPPLIDAQTISLKGRVVMPAFVECHTHSIFAGSRAHEFEWRMQGQTYQQIAEKGGGILSTVAATRTASFESLLHSASARTQIFVQQGVTTIEIKSGYGLDLASELKILKVSKSIQGPRVVTTYLGPHSRAPEFANCKDYLKAILGEHLPEVVRSGLVDRADIYIESGFFSLEDAAAYLSAVQALNIPITAHVEQLSAFGGLNLALQFSPQSLDHVVYATPEDIKAIAKSETTAVLLPGSDFYLKMQYPPARALIDAGACVALATDFNPGTCPTQDLSLIGVLARNEMKMTLPEVLSAYTVGAAHALGLQRELGSLEAEKQCDFIVLDDSWESLFYSVGHHPVAQVWKSGNAIWTAQKSH